jgi:hypothetical protein
MGLLTTLTTNGSTFSYGNGVTPTTNVGATSLSKLHADGSTPGYSLDGSDFSTVNAAYQAYNDGTTNILPQPSQLDLNGATPTQYINNLPQ